MSLFVFTGLLILLVLIVKDVPERRLADQLPEFSAKAEEHGMYLRPEDFENEQPESSGREGWEVLAEFNRKTEGVQNEVYEKSTLSEEASYVYEAIEGDSELKALLDELSEATFPLSASIFDLMGFPQLVEAKNVVGLLSAAGVGAAEQGLVDSSSDYLLAALQVGEATTEAPLLIAGLVRIAVQAEVAQYAQEAARRLPPNEGAHLLERLADDMDAEKDFAWYIRGEPAIMFNLFGEMDMVLEEAPGMENFLMTFVIDPTSEVHRQAHLARNLQNLLPILDAYERGPAEAHEMAIDTYAEFTGEMNLINLFDGTRLFAAENSIASSIIAFESVRAIPDALRVAAELNRARTDEGFPNDLPSAAREVTDRETAYRPHEDGYLLVIDSWSDGLQTKLTDDPHILPKETDDFWSVFTRPPVELPDPSDLSPVELGFPPASLPGSPSAPPSGSFQPN